MYSHYNFSKIYEAEQAGTPLNPEEMGMESTGSTDSSEPKLEDFEAIKNAGYQIEIMLTQADMDNLIKDGKYSTNEAKWKRTDNKTDVIDIKSLIINVGDHQVVQDANSIVFKIDADTAKRIVDTIKDGGTATESIASISPKIINGITVAFIKSNELSTEVSQTVKPASQEQVDAGAIVPPAVSGDMNTTPNESVTPKRIMSFNQFLNEGKKGDWIADVVKDMDKGALKKELGGKVTKGKIAKEEAKLTKKDKDKKKPGLQLNAKDAKTHKRNILAKNLLNAVSEQNEVGQGESSFAGDEKRTTGYFRDNISRDVEKPYHFGKDKMKTGSDEVDTNTLEYTGLVTKLKNSLNDPTIKSGTPLTVIGGASKVGYPTYDNNALAQRRADKFVAKLKLDVPGLEKKYKITTIARVGQETTKDSPKAFAEQFVDVSFLEQAKALQVVSTEVDNMVGYNAKIYPQKKKDDDIVPGITKNKRVCVQIPEQFVDEYVAMINKFKKDNSLPNVKYGIYDIK
jgi:hypothetical protein